MKAKLIKKDSPLQEQLKQSRKNRKLKKKTTNVARTAIEVTTEWLKNRREGSSNAREVFASLFTNTDPQSA